MPTRASLVGFSSEIRRIKIPANMGGVDIDGDNLVTIIDLFLVIFLWFAFCLALLLCYAVFDTFDKIQRKRDMEMRNEVEQLHPQDEFEKLEEDTETDQTDESTVGSLDGVRIDCDGECAHFRSISDLKELA